LETVNDIKYEWADYLVSRKTNVKRLWKPKLNELINKIEALKNKELEKYLNLLCEAYFDYNLEIPIAHPTIWSRVLRQWENNISCLDVKNLMWIYKAYNYNNVYELFNVEPYQILEKVLELESSNEKAEELLFLGKLDTLDFALHELPTGLVMDKEVCIKCIDYCELKIQKNKKLSNIKTRFNLDFVYYKNLFFYWQEYKVKNIKEDFFEWIRAQQTNKNEETNNFPSRVNYCS